MENQYQSLRKDDANFIRKLDKKLHETTEFTYCTLPATQAGTTDNKMTKEEAEQLLSIIKGYSNLILSPTDELNFGMSVGFEVASIDYREPLLLFAQDQLPRGYSSWNMLSKIFMQPNNLKRFKKRAKKFGLHEEEIVNDRNHYEY